MAEYIEKHKAVNLLTYLENEFQQFNRSKVLNTQCIVNCAKRKSLSGNYQPPTLCRWCMASGCVRTGGIAIFVMIVLFVVMR